MKRMMNRAICFRCVECPTQFHDWSADTEKQAFDAASEVGWIRDKDNAPLCAFHSQSEQVALRAGK